MAAENIYIAAMKKSLLSVVVLLFVLLVACKKPLAPEYLGFQDFSLQSFSTEESLLKADLSFYNPNSFNMELQRGDVDVFLDDKLANHYVMDSTIFIPQKDTFYVPVLFKLNPGFLINRAINAFLNNNQIKVRLAGSVRVKKSGFVFNVPINYEVMQSLNGLK